VRARTRNCVEAFVIAEESEVLVRERRLASDRKLFGRPELEAPHRAWQHSRVGQPEDAGCGRTDGAKETH
jgi:hypothetical protein